MIGKEKAMDRVFDICNLIGEDADIMKEMTRFKVFSTMSEEEYWKTVDAIAFRLGFMW